MFQKRFTDRVVRFRAMAESDCCSQQNANSLRNFLFTVKRKQPRDLGRNCSQLSGHFSRNARLPTLVRLIPPSFEVIRPRRAEALEETRGMHGL